MMSCGTEDDMNFLVDTSVCVSAPGGLECSVQPAPDTPRPSSRGARAKPQYNRSTIKIEDFLSKPAESITAKEYRVLIPTMFQQMLHPNKEIAKTKVKGLWEQGNRPNGWPPFVKFRDPNNHPKFQIRESKAVFTFLREKLCQQQKYEQYMAAYPSVKSEPKKSPSLKSHERFNIPNIPSLQSTQTSFLPQEDVKTLMVPQQQQPMTSMQSTSETTPNYVQQDLGVTLTEVKAEPVEFYYDNEQVMNGVQQPQAVEVLSSETIADTENNTTVRSLTLLQNAAIPCETDMPSFPTDAQQPNVMIVCAAGDDTASQPLHPQSPDGSQSIEMPFIPSCVSFAKGIQENLLPTVVEFSKTFEKNYPVLQKVEDVIKDTFVPIFNLAKCNKETCAELSKLGSRLQEMLKRFSFMNEAYSTESIIAELEVLQEDFKPQEIVVNVPEATHEVMVMTATNQTVPTLADPKDPYIPTIADLKARAERKEMELQTERSGDLGPTSNEECKETAKCNVMSPFCKELEEMNLDETDADTASLHPEKDCGIKLKEADDVEDSTPMDIEQIMQELEYLNQGNALGIDVRPATIDEIIEVNELVTTNTAAAPLLASPTLTENTTAQPCPVQPATDDFFQMSLDNGPFHIEVREQQAVDASIEAAISHFCGSLTMDQPPVNRVDDTSYITDDVLSLEEDFNSLLPSLDGPITSFIPQPSNITQLAPVQLSAPQPQQEDIFAKLLSQQPEAVIPVTVYEAAERPEGPAPKRSRSRAKPSARRNSEGGVMRGKGKGVGKRM